MKIKLIPDSDIKVQKLNICRISTHILRPAEIAEVPVVVLWIHGGGYITGMKEMVYMSRTLLLVIIQQAGKKRTDMIRKSYAE